MYEPFYAPSPEEIQEIQRKELQYDQALEYVSIISETDSQSEVQAVKCQRCGKAVPMPAANVVAKTALDIDIERKRNQLERAQKHPVSSQASKEATLNLIKRELDELLQEKARRLRCLPLVRTRKTGYKWVCYACFDYVCRHGHPRPFPRAPIDEHYSIYRAAGLRPGSGSSSSSAGGQSSCSKK